MGTQVHGNEQILMAAGNGISAASTPGAIPEPEPEPPDPEPEPEPEPEP